MDIFSPTILIIAGFIIVVLGIGAGMLLGSINEEGEPEEGAPQSPPGAVKGRYTPVARLWRDTANGALVVEIDGKTYVSAQGLDELRRSNLEQSARDLRSWLGMGLSGAAEPAASVEPAPAERTPAPSAPQAAPPAAPRPIQVQPTRVQPTTTRTVLPPAVDEPAAAVMGSKSIVMQIEDILQDMLVGSPLANRGIHLIEDPLRGVIVKVGIDQFEGIEAVTDPDVKAFIRSAVAEWEKSQ